VEQQGPYSVDRIILREVALPLKEPFSTATGRVDIRRLIIVEAWCDGVAGYGEASPLSEPFYTEETTETAWHVLESFLVPRVLGRAWSSPAEVASWFAPIRRHYMAKAGLEAAAWDLYARLMGLSLSEALGGERRFVPSGIAIGVQDDLAALAAKVKRALEEGYRRIKIKIKPGWDLEPVRFLRDRFGDFPLMADANSAYSLADVEHLKRLDPFGLMMIEQPLAWDDIVDHARLQKELATPVCLDESITSADAARHALELGSCRVINIKPARVGGLCEAVRILHLCRERGVPAWCGGMLESGIGRAHMVALASLPGFDLPGDISASDRYWREEIVDPPFRLLPGGFIAVPQGDGIGVAIDHGALRRFTVRLREFTG